MGISEYDLNNRFAPGGSAGTDYLITLNHPPGSSLVTCVVTDNDNGGAPVANSSALIQNGDEAAAKEEAALKVRRILGVPDTVLHCLTTVQKGTLTGVLDGTQIVDITAARLESRIVGAWRYPSGGGGGGDNANVEVVVISGVESYTLSESVSGKFLAVFPPDGRIEIHVPDLPSGFNCALQQKGGKVGDVRFIPGENVALDAWANDDKSAGRFAVIHLQRTAVNQYSLSGRTT